MSYPDNATASIAQFLFRDSQGAMYIIPRRAFHNGSQYGDTVTIVQDLSGNGNDLTGTGTFARRPFYGGPAETMNNARDVQYVENPAMTAPVGNLGDDCTIVVAMPGENLSIDTNQSVTSDYSVNQDFSLIIILNRELTESESRVIKELASRWCGAGFNPLINYTSGEQGAYYAPWDISTLWQDADRTVPVTACGDPVRVMDDLSPNGNHAVAPTSAARGTYGRMPAGVGVINELTHTDSLTTQSITVTAEERTLSFEGSGTVTLTGASTAGPLVGGGSLTFTPSSGTLTLTVSGDVKNAQLSIGGSPLPYQRVGNEYDVSQEGVPDVYYIETDGIDDGYQTAPIDLTMYDSTSLAVGAQWLGNTPSIGFIVEFRGQTGLNQGAFSMVKGSISNGWGFMHRGTDGPLQYPGESPDNDPHIFSLSGDIAESLLLWGVDSAGGQLTDSQGTGTLSDYPLSLFSRNASVLYFQGRFFGAIIVHPRSPYEEQNRQFLAKKAGVTL